VIVRRGTRPKSGFYILAHSIAEDNRLSWEARGVLVFLLVKPDDWQVSVAHLVKQGHAGRDKVYGIIKELMDSGYATREQARGTGKFSDTTYIIHELPLTAFQEAAAPLTENQEAAPLTGLPLTDSPYTANPTLVNNHLQQESKENLLGPQAARLDQAETILKAVKGLYPKREGSHRWPDALKHIRARLKEGHTSEEMLAGAERYAAFSRVKSIAGSGMVQQAATFFGANKGFLEAWEVQRTGGSPKTEADAAKDKLDRDVIAARATASKFGLRQPMRGEPPETFVARIDREHADQLTEILRQQADAGNLSKAARKALGNAGKTTGSKP
jgi:hypothetical protein